MKNVSFPHICSCSSNVNTLLNRTKLEFDFDIGLKEELVFVSFHSLDWKCRCHIAVTTAII